MMEEVRRGQIWYYTPDTNMMHTQRFTRPCVVVSNDTANHFSPMVTIVPLTSSPKKKPLPTHCKLMCDGIQSTALCEQMTVIDKSRLWRFVHYTSTQEMREIGICMLIQLGIL